MKKLFFVCLGVLCVVLLAACGAASSPQVEIDYGSSTIYSEKDMREAIQVIENEFNTWKGCELHSITYGSDDNCTAENLAWMNDLEAANDAQETFTQCIQFTSSFHSPKEDAGAWESDKEYTDWGWWLARSDGGQWKLMTWGYG